MAMNKSLFHPHNYQIAAPIICKKIRSKSSDSASNNHRNSDSQEKENHIDVTPKMKTSQSTLTNFEPTCNAASLLRRRFSLFRIKRPQTQSEHVNIPALQEIIEKLRNDLQMKTNELQTIKKHIDNKRYSLIQPCNESIEQAMQMQTMLNVKLEEILTENDLLKKSIQELESYAQQQKSKSNISFFFVLFLSIIISIYDITRITYDRFLLDHKIEKKVCIYM